MVASGMPCESSPTVSRSGHRVDSMRRRRSVSTDSSKPTSNARTASVTGVADILVLLSIPPDLSPPPPCLAPAFLAIDRASHAVVAVSTDREPPRSAPRGEQPRLDGRFGLLEAGGGAQGVGLVGALPREVV